MRWGRRNYSVLPNLRAQSNGNAHERGNRNAHAIADA
jgi:hypothetical protein